MSYEDITVTLDASQMMPSPIQFTSPVPCQESIARPCFAPNMFKRLVLGCGINAVLYYAPQIFASFGFSSTKTTLLATGVTGILQITFTLPAVLFLDKLGRKTFLIAGAIGMFCPHVVVATVEGLYQDDWNKNIGLDKAQGWVAIAFIWL
ncbi:hypothetical protein CFD26_106028 [Aspergillus turcosus]|uniref:Major facilitator superfamily (MFS) profile domain-containing protein n=1 Tax=Aspergillus turcosus TaxID=1245748 RepID=A0A421D175_9EURO|nr:hypothetical protein CFD26_106028 [Aspergillus turcosus]